MQRLLDPTTHLACLEELKTTLEPTLDLSGISFARKKNKLKSILEAVSVNPNITTWKFNQCHFDDYLFKSFEINLLHTVADALPNAKYLRSIEAKKIFSHENNVSPLIKALQNNKTVSEVYLSHLSSDSFEAVIKLLPINNTLTTLSIGYIDLYRESAKDFSKALEKNKSLKKLFLPFLGVSTYEASLESEGYAYDLKKSLRFISTGISNCLSLQTVDLSQLSFFNHTRDNDFSDDDDMSISYFENDMGKALNQLFPDEKKSDQHLRHLTLSSDSEKVFIQDIIKKIQDAWDIRLKQNQKQDQEMAFQMGRHPRLGETSQAHHVFFRGKMANPRNLFPLVSEFLGAEGYSSKEDDVEEEKNRENRMASYRQFTHVFQTPQSHQDLVKAYDNIQHQKSYFNTLTAIHFWLDTAANFLANQLIKTDGKDNVSRKLIEKIVLHRKALCSIFQSMLNKNNNEEEAKYMLQVIIIGMDRTMMNRELKNNASPNPVQTQLSSLINLYQEKFFFDEEKKSSLTETKKGLK